MFLLAGKYTGSTKELFFKRIQVALEEGTIHLEELDITEEQWSDLEKEFIEKDVGLPVEKMTLNEAKVLARNFGILWQGYKKVDDAEQKEEMLNLLKSLWPRVNHAVTLRLVTHADLGIEAGEYFEIANAINPPKK